MDKTKPTHATVRVRATALGSSNGRRRVGEVFDARLPLNEKGEPKLGTWLELAPADEPITAEVRAGTSKKKGQTSLGKGAKDAGADLV